MYKECKNYNRLCKVKKVASYLHSAILQIFHGIKDALQLHLPPPPSSDHYVIIYEVDPPPLWSTSWRVHNTWTAISWYPSQCSELIYDVHIPPITIIHKVLVLPTHRGSAESINRE